MNKDRLEKFLCTTEMTLAMAMEKIDANAKGILFVVDDRKVLVGTITDGDIRRALLRTGDLHTQVGDAMSRNPHFLLCEDVKAINVKSFMKNLSITAVPILNPKNRIKDIILLSEIDEDQEPQAVKSLYGVPVVIMAGGKGTRLYPYTKILPKPLIPIGETPIIERIMDRFAGYGVDSFMMTVNYKKGMMKAYFSELAPNYSIEYVEEDKPLGTAGSIKLISKRPDKPLFIANCDSIILADYGDLYQHHLDSGNDITVVSSLKNFTVPFGVLEAGEDGELIKLVEKPKMSYFINTGMYVINPAVIDEIPEDEFFHMTHLIDKIMEKGGKVGMYPISEDSFLDMGEFGEMKRMEEKLHIVTEQ